MENAYTVNFSCNTWCDENREKWKKLGLGREVTPSSQDIQKVTEKEYQEMQADKQKICDELVEKKLVIKTED